jgi:hypothetical protein|tara:strand:+ start:123 stop:335 length:213 start_codon:yes stop_codon:yes gene_type:complete
MDIKLWYSKTMEKWRWTLMDANQPFDQHGGEREDFHDAMGDITKTVEYILEERRKGGMIHPEWADGFVGK